MSQKTVRSIILVALVIMLSACSALPSLASTATPSSTATNAIVNKLGLGLLKLEETSYAISANQAKDLLPLWKAVKAMGADRNASQVEIEALYAQMQESLTADQLQFITELNLASSEVTSLVQKSAILASQDTTQVATTQTTRTSSSSSIVGGPGGGPGGDFGGGPGAIPGVDIMGGGSATTSSTQTTSQSLAKATAAARASSVNSTTNVQLASSIIQLLEKRVNA